MIATSYPVVAEQAHFYKVAVHFVHCKCRDNEVYTASFALSATSLVSHHAPLGWGGPGYSVDVPPEEECEGLSEEGLRKLSFLLLSGCLWEQEQTQMEWDAGLIWWHYSWSYLHLYPPPQHHFTLHIHGGEGTYKSIHVQTKK